MEIVIAANPNELGELAAAQGREFIRNCVAETGCCNVVFATGTSQFVLLECLCRDRAMPWQEVVGFHLDEYLGLSADHAASFCHYLRTRLTNRVPIGEFHFIRSDASQAELECRRLADLIERHPIDLAFVGIGENGHLAFNDPPADFQTTSAYLVVQLDDACRRQQVGEGWFDSLKAVPTRAITMSICQIMRSRRIICSAPDSRKAPAVAAAIRGPVGPSLPASILQQHNDVTIFLDPPSARMLSG